MTQQPHGVTLYRPSLLHTDTDTDTNAARLTLASAELASPKSRLPKSRFWVHTKTSDVVGGYRSGVWYRFRAAKPSRPSTRCRVASGAGLLSSLADNLKPDS